jgi:hypothetical protein
MVMSSALQPARRSGEFAISGDLSVVRLGFGELRIPGSGVWAETLLRLVHERQIRYVMVNGIAHVPDDALEEYRARAS